MYINWKGKKVSWKKVSDFCGIMFDLQNLKYMIESVSLGIIPSMKSSILAEGIASPFFTAPISLRLKV